VNIDLTTLRDIVVVLVPMILSLTVHEFAHAWTAHKLGDDTAARQGRMTLNPISHIDIFGTLLIPIFSVVSGGIGLIGWAKPVPVSPHRFHRNITMRNGMIITALAGPASNVLLALIVGGASMMLFSDAIDDLSDIPKVGSRTMAFLMIGSEDFAAANVKFMNLHGIADKGQSIAALLLSRIFVMNLGLAFFNMLPVPPLDGSRVLPLEWQAKLSRYTMVVFIVFIVAINSFGSIMWGPISFMGDAVLGFWSLIF
jgi:Zn-dependent protease